MGCLKLPYHSNQEYRETSFSHLKVVHNRGVKSHRYGFQGQEKDDEIKGKGNSVNYTFRMHDPRLGRFFAIDPLTGIYPELTPYQFSSNSPIGMVELEGLEGTPVVGQPSGDPSTFGNPAAGSETKPKVEEHPNGDWVVKYQSTVWVYDGDIRNGSYTKLRVVSMDAVKVPGSAPRQTKPMRPL